MNKERKKTPRFYFGVISFIFVPFAHILCANRNLASLHKILRNVPYIFFKHARHTLYQAEKAYFVDSDYRDKTIYSGWLQG